VTPLALIRRALSILLGITFLSLVFLYWPHEVRALNAELGWPVWTHPVARALGVLLIAVGATLFVRCTLLFGRRGSGTPVPTDPPAKLVIEGPFRWSRNPIYVGYVIALVGEALLFGQAALAFYTVVCTLAFHLIIVFGEEPLLRHRFGDEYRRYAEQVPRWLGSMRRTEAHPEPTDHEAQA